MARSLLAGPRVHCVANKQYAGLTRVLFAVPYASAILAWGALTLGCGGGGAIVPTPPPLGISVSVIPSSATVFLGARRQFTATVTGSSNTVVIWSVSGPSCSGAACGTIDSTGLFTAPQVLPEQTTINIQASSQADSSKSAAATVNIASDVAITLTPGAADVELGAARQYLANVSGSGNPSQAVSWGVTGPGCIGTTCGTVSASGLFTAPQVRPVPPSLTVTAKSAADPSKSASSTVNVTSNFTLTVSGPTSVDAAATVQFTATLTPAPNSNPSTAINWSVSGPGCSGTTCGTVTSTGGYTAPTVAPLPNTVNITATPAADPAKAVTRAVTINAVLNVTLAPNSASVELGQQQNFTATVTGASDTRVAWDVNGIAGGDLAVGTITNAPADPNNATYTAPINMPMPNQVTVRARSNANPNVFATATVTLFSMIGVQLSPGSSTRAISHKQTFNINVTRTSNQRVAWQVNSIPAGDARVGQICVVNVDPCQPVTTTVGGGVDYLAPASVPTSNPVTISAISQADPSKSGSAPVTILAHILVSVVPSSVTLESRASQQFTAQVDGTSNQSVTWRVSGAGCSGAGSPCGTVDSTGFYIAPISPPSPNTLSITATSAEDTSRSAAASVTIATGPNITSLLPASATAGAAGGFTLRVLGGGFSASSPGPASTIFFNGIAKTTTCSSGSECTTTLAAADLAAAGGVPVQIRNPDSPRSNQVSFVVVQPATSEDVIPLTPAAATVSGKDIVVVEPSTAGTSSDLNFTLLAMGPYSVGSGNCALGGNPIVLARPASGTASFDICAFSLSGLDPALNYAITGPTPNDVTIVGKQPLGLGIIHLTLQVTSTALKGPRSLLVENTNRDIAVASGALEVK